MKFSNTEFDFLRGLLTNIAVKKTKKMADLQGFEPRQSEPESLVLPLHHRSALCHIIYHTFYKMQIVFSKNRMISDKFPYSILTKR